MSEFKKSLLIPDWGRYEGETKDGLAHGVGSVEFGPDKELHFPSGIYAGQFENGMLHGKGNTHEKIHHKFREIFFFRWNVLYW